MKAFGNPIVIRAEFFYEVLLPFLGARGWQYEVDAEDGEEVMVLALENPDGESQKRSQGNALIDNLLKGATLAPFYVYLFQGSYHRHLDGVWKVYPGAAAVAVAQQASELSDLPGVSAVNIYRNTETMKKDAWTRAKRGFLPFKCRFVQIEDFLDVGVWESDCHSYDTAAGEVETMRDTLHGVGAVYVRTGEWKRGE